ncbi:FG-GAP-like repeat-containing protein, partial [Flavobacteriales bacterium]|nr:FG-GAP-like repeat-containing protein [Flavobacteriales bacterium]
FTDVTVSESVFVANGCGLSASFSDFDRDGDLDILVGNDFGYWTWTVGNTLFENDNGNLVEASENYAFDIDINAMSMAGGDIDEDQDLDYYITNINGNALMRNDGSSFVDIAESAGVKGEFNLIDTTGAQYVDAVCWGAVFFDYDNDTYQDLFVSNGKLASFLADTTAYFQNRLFKNESASGSFEDVSEQAGMSSPLLSKGCASADYDHDGDVDMVIVTMDTIDGVSRTLLMENINGNQKNWLQLNLKGVVSNFDALGTMVSVHVDGRTFIREIDGGGSSYMSQNSKVVHFGLDTYQEVDSVTVVWPVSAPTTLYNVEVNQRIDVTELQNPLGVNERSRHIVSVFPNPAEDYFTLTTANTPIISFEVFNSSGILVHKEELENVSSHKVDISFLSSGVYSLGVTSNVTKIWKRLVIQ